MAVRESKNTPISLVMDSKSKVDLAKEAKGSSISTTPESKSKVSLNNEAKPTVTDWLDKELK